MNITPISYNSQNNKPAFKAMAGDISELVKFFETKGKIGADFFEELRNRSSDIQSIKYELSEVVFEVRKNLSKKDSNSLSIISYTNDKPEVKGTSLLKFKKRSFFGRLAEVNTNRLVDAIKKATDDIKNQPESIQVDAKKVKAFINGVPYKDSADGLIKNK